MKVREDYKKKMGSRFALEEFRNNFLKEGSPPVKYTSGRHCRETIHQRCRGR